MPLWPDDGDDGSMVTIIIMKVMMKIVMTLVLVIETFCFLLLFSSPSGRCFTLGCVCHPLYQTRRLLSKGRSVDVDRPQEV